ncbi:MAG: type II toxin-antitoxin system HicA family toxin [Deltaproteobacteria bacterium]|nr:type II toxin-antitoxin system HicA family toxin [Deltaproteobacteria bacterium]
MKRKDLIRAIEEIGCVFIRHGGRHDWYQNPETKISQPVPRHSGQYRLPDHLRRDDAALSEVASTSAKRS